MMACYGEAGDDIIYGMSGNDTLDGGNRNRYPVRRVGPMTILFADERDDWLYGEAGDDSFYADMARVSQYPWRNR